VRAMLRADPATAGKDLLALPYRVDAYWTERSSTAGTRPPK
jgi:hypothetical protein